MKKDTNILIKFLKWSLKLLSSMAWSILLFVFLYLALGSILGFVSLLKDLAYAEEGYDIAISMDYATLGEKYPALIGIFLLISFLVAIGVFGTSLHSKYRSKTLRFAKITTVISFVTFLVFVLGAIAVVTWTA